MNQSNKHEGNFTISRTRELHKLLAEEGADHSRNISFVHLVNPVEKPPEHELSRAQAVTYKSMRSAASFAMAQDPFLQVQLAATAFPEDAPAHPEGFIVLPPLERASEDVASFRVPRRLPLLHEVLEKGAACCEAADLPGDTYLVFTNIDIGVMPHFYAYCAWLVRHDFDTVIINRRTIADFYPQSESDWPAMLSDFGGNHPGLDCFVIKASILKKLSSFQSIIGMGYVMRALLYDLVANSSRATIILDAHATFHVGDAMDWVSEKFNDYREFNKAECLKTIAALIAQSPALEARLANVACLISDIFWMPAGTLNLTFQDRNPTVLIGLKRFAKTLLRR